MKIQKSAFLIFIASFQIQVLAQEFILPARDDHDAATAIARVFQGQGFSIDPNQSAVRYLSQSTQYAFGSPAGSTAIYSRNGNSLQFARVEAIGPSLAYEVVDVIMDTRASVFIRGQRDEKLALADSIRRFQLRAMEQKGFDPKNENLATVEWQLEGSTAGYIYRNKISGTAQTRNSVELLEPNTNGDNQLKITVGQHDIPNVLFYNHETSTIDRKTISKFDFQSTVSLPSGIIIYAIFDQAALQLEALILEPGTQLVTAYKKQLKRSGPNGSTLSWYGSMPVTTDMKFPTGLFESNGPRAVTVDRSACVQLFAGT